MIVNILTPDPDIQNMKRVYIIEPAGDLANAQAFASSTSVYVIFEFLELVDLTITSLVAHL